MLEILVGFVVGYDQREGRARVRVRSPLHPGDTVRFVGGRTDRELKLKAPRLRENVSVPADGEVAEVDVLVPAVEPGDMVFRVVNPMAAKAEAVA